jgi:hypothetical protein
MKKCFPVFLLFILTGIFNCAGQIWSSVAAGSRNSRIAAEEKQSLWRLNIALLPAQLQQDMMLDLPLPDGSLRRFSITPNALLPPGLAARYPNIKAYNAIATDDATVSAKIDVTDFGLHAMIFAGAQSTTVDPAGNGLYIARSKSDAAANVRCLVPATGRKQNGLLAAQRIASGYKLKQYRMALACDHQYAQAATGSDHPTKSATLSKMVTTLNRINGVYERELAITMTLVPNTDTLIYTDTVGDPFGTSNSNPATLLYLNQLMCDSLIKTANYDLGHLFSTGAGGLSQVGCVCNSAMKAQSVTGRNQPEGDEFDIDYVAHEIGHAFGANHTFNNNESGSCAGNAEAEFAYEPGSGSTIMAYAGICSPDNIQAHSDAYFGISSLREVTSYVSAAGNCYTAVNTANKPVGLPLFTAFYNIPKLTPFEFTAPTATDSTAGSAITYCWEQWNLGDFGRSLAATHTAGPIFRSFTPDTTRTRIFPKLAMVLAGNTSDAGNNNSEGEQLPDQTRYLTFRLTVRNILAGTGCFLITDDSIHIDVAGSAGPFKVTSQNETGLLYIGSSIQQVNWDVAGSTDAPVNAATVDIYLSGDDGTTWPYFLGNFPNNGSAIVTLPNPTGNIVHGRFKVKAHGNIFFNVNLQEFAVINNPDSNSAIRLFPDPAHSYVKIITGTRGTVSTQIFDNAGRIIWSGEINGLKDIDVSMWPRAMYVVKFRDVRGRDSFNKLVVY